MRRIAPALRARQRGFTLLEVIVAFMLLALALTLLLGTLSGAAKQVRWSADAARAGLHAQSLLDATGWDAPLAPGERTGEFDGGRYRWTLDVSPYQDAGRAPQPQQPGAPRLLRLDLDVRWGQDDPRQRLHVQTLRLQTPTQDAGALP